MQSCSGLFIGIEIVVKFDFVSQVLSIFGLNDHRITEFSSFSVTAREESV